MSRVNLTRRPPCNGSENFRYRAREHVDSAWSGQTQCGGDSHLEAPSSPGSVGLARARPPAKTQAMEPSRQARSSYGPPYPLGRWCSANLKLFYLHYYTNFRSLLWSSVTQTPIVFGLLPFTQHCNPMNCSKFCNQSALPKT